MFSILNLITNKIKRNKLTLIANKYQSDKGTIYSSQHNFTDIYEKYFKKYKNKKIKILEIGAHDGASLKTWLEYFPNSIIHALDIDDRSQLNNNRINCFVLDQSNEEELKRAASYLLQDYDIIIDDGSHHMRDQQITFYYMFKLLKNNGLYIIEDLHTSLCDNKTLLYGRQIEIHKDRVNTTLNYLVNNCANSIYLNEEQNQYLIENIAYVNIYNRYNSMVPSEYKHRSITSIIGKR
jgi:hypothetical protein